MIVNKVLAQRIIISLISDLTVYAPQYGLNNSQKDDFMTSLSIFLKVRAERNFSFSSRL